MANANHPSGNRTKSLKTPARAKAVVQAATSVSNKAKAGPVARKPPSGGAAPGKPAKPKVGAATAGKAAPASKTGLNAPSKSAPSKASAAKKLPQPSQTKPPATAKPVKKTGKSPPASTPVQPARGKAPAPKNVVAVAAAKSKPAVKAAELPRTFVTISKPEPIAAKGKTRTHGGMPPGMENGVTMQDGRYALPATVRIELPHTYKPSSKEEYMGPRHLQYFRNKLSQWREDLVEESRQTIESLRDEVRDVGDEAERATRETENSLELRTRDRYRKLIAKIDKALKRIEEGHYGFCEETDEEIGLDRLEARPIATLSLDAQERWEHRQKQMGD